MANDIDAKIKVVAELDPRLPSGIRFTPVSSHFNNGELTFKSPKKGDRFIMIFKLDDQTGMGLRFHTDVNWVFWASETACPQTHAADWQFKVKLRENGTLKVINRNDEVAKYFYAINFTKDDGDVVLWDPVINNQNGGSKAFQLRDFLAVVGAVSLVAAVVFGLKLLFT